MTNQIKESVCPKCSNKFGLKEDLQQHQMTIHTCNVCNMIYKSPHTIMNHFKSLQKESPECKKCQKKFQTKYDLDTYFENNHKRTIDRN